MQTTYLDYNATTPLDADVREAMRPFLEACYGNPSSVHKVGRLARAALDESRERVAAVWRCKPSEVVFTSGGTESNNLALAGACRALRHRGRHLVTSPTEHHAVLHCLQALSRHDGFELTLLPVDRWGLVDASDVRRAIRADTILVSVMAANNETGLLQPVAQIGDICSQSGVVFHTDAVQWFGKCRVDGIGSFHADLVSFCAHKLYGPKGAGALFVRSGLLIEPLLRGGAHEQEKRAGTENLASIVGLAVCVGRFVNPPVFPSAALAALTQQISEALTSIEGVRCQSFGGGRLPNTVSFTVAGCDQGALLAGLDLEGICASSGSACSAGSLEPSHVLRAMGLSVEEAGSMVRFSLGRETTESEVAHLLGVLPGVVERIRNVR